MGDGGRQSRIDAACLYAVTVAGADDVKRMLDPENVLSAGCRVLKHPDCCVLCAANNDCDRIPLHWNCRCKPEGFLKIAE